MTGQDEDFSHRANRTMTARACKAARRVRIASHWDFATHTQTDSGACQFRDKIERLAFLSLADRLTDDSQMKQRSRLSAGFITVTAIGLASCAGGPGSFRAYDGPDLAAAEVSVLTFQPWWEMGTIVSVTAAGVSYFDSRKDHDPGFYESGWKKVDVLLKPGVYDVRYKGKCLRGWEVERTDSVALQAGHTYRMDGGCPFTTEVRLWIEDTTTNQVIVGSKHEAAH